MSDAFLSRLQSGLRGTYVVERELSGGGVCRVFAGTETTLGRVVVKVLPAECAARAPIERFEREAELGARLEHPHIVPVYDVGEVDDIRYFTMPFIDGETLRQRLDRNGALSADEVFRVLREIGSALAYAHGRGVVHRDVKPENIFIENTTERALLADFGVAMAVGGRSDATHAGGIVGTPAYMSPEQAAAAEIDGRSDVYSLGLVGWEMLTGRRPWSDPYDSVRDIMQRQKHDLLPLLADLGIDAPRDLIETIERALLKDRRLRWATAAAFVGGLGAGVRDPESAVTTQRLEARGRRPVPQTSEASGEGPALQGSEGSGERPAVQRSEASSERPAPQRSDAGSERPALQRSEAGSERPALQSAQDQGSEIRAQGPDLQQEQRHAQRRDPEPEPERTDERLESYPGMTPQGSEFQTGRREEWRADPVRGEEWRADPVRGEEWRADPVRWDDELAAVWGSGRRRGPGRRYVVAALVLVCGAAIVGAAIVGPETMMQRFTNVGAVAEPLNAVDASTGDIDTRIDRVSAGDMAAGLIGVEGARARAPRATMPMTARRSRLPPTRVAPIGAAEHVERVAADRPRSDVRRKPASSGNSVHARIATAILTMLEYERVQAEMSAARAGMSRAPAAPSPTPPPPPASRPATPSEKP